MTNRETWCHFTHIGYWLQGSDLNALSTWSTRSCLYRSCPYMVRAKTQLILGFTKGEKRRPRGSMRITSKLVIKVVMGFVNSCGFCSFQKIRTSYKTGYFKTEPWRNKNKWGDYSCVCKQKTNLGPLTVNTQLAIPQCDFNMKHTSCEEVYNSTHQSATECIAVAVFRYIFIRDHLYNFFSFFTKRRYKQAGWGYFNNSWCDKYTIKKINYRKQV